MGIMHSKTQNGHTYIIAEAGQNHNGDIEKAKWLIDIAALRIGHGEQDNIFHADAIKFCKRDMTTELTVQAYNEPYTGKHSYGETYGKHREALELTYEEHAELFLYAKKRGLDFIETICSPECLQLLRWFRPDFIKVASRDIDNIPLLEAISKVDIPIILSSGMADMEMIEKAIGIIGKNQNDITVLHCVSQYPSQYENLNFESIKYLKDNLSYVPCAVGFSDHTTGVLAPSIAVMAGAQVIEKHITYNRMAKGSDHAGSMDAEGYARVIRDIRNTEIARGSYCKLKPKGIGKAENKLKRSLCIRRDIGQGEKIREEDLIMLSPGEGLRYCERSKVIGKIAKHRLFAMSMIKEEDLK